MPKAEPIEGPVHKNRVVRAGEGALASSDGQAIKRGLPDDGSPCSMALRANPGAPVGKSGPWPWGTPRHEVTETTTARDR